MNLELRCTKRKKKCVRFKRLSYEEDIFILPGARVEFQLWVVPCPQYSNHHVSWHLCSSQRQTPHSSTTETVPSNPLHLCVFISGYWQFFQLLVKPWSSPRSLLPSVSSHILRVSMLGGEKAVSSLLLSYTFHCLPHPLDLISPLCLRHSLILILGPFITSLSNAREFSVSRNSLFYIISFCRKLQSVNQ